MTDNRRLLFIAPSAYPLGGVATWIDYLLPGLEEQGWEPTLGLAAGKYHDAGRYLAEHPFHRVRCIYNPTGSQEGRVRALCDAVLQVDPAVVLSVNISDTYLAMARLRSSGRSKAKAVMTLHGIQTDLLADAHTFRYVLDAVICTNRLTCELVYERAAVAPGRVHYAPYGVEIVPVDLSNRKTNADRLRIAWVGRLEEEQKQVSDIPRILQLLDQRGIAFELWVVGTGPDEGRLRQQLAPWLGDGRAQIWGALPREQVYRDIYRNADIFLLTSSWETGPIVLWEAMSFSLPAVTSDYLGAGPEGSLVDQKNCLMYPVGDIECAVDCIARFQDPNLRSDLGAQALSLVSERYTTGASIAAWSGVLNDICASDLKKIESPEMRLPPRGRLDHWLGVRTGETLRRTVGLRFEHQDAGGEWPHTNSGVRLNGI